MFHSVSGWTRGVKVKLWDPLSTRAIPERLRGVIMTRRYTNPRLPLPYLYKFPEPEPWLAGDSEGTVSVVVWNNLPAALWRPERPPCSSKRQLKACPFHIWCANKQKEHPPLPALLWSFCDCGAGYKTVHLLTNWQDQDNSSQDQHQGRVTIIIIIIIIIHEFHRDASLEQNFRAAMCHVLH